MKTIILRPIYSKNIAQTWVRFKSTKRFIDPERADSLPVFQYASNSDKKCNRIYTWGLAEHGALGESQFIKPVIKGRYPVKYMHRPYRIALDNGLEVKDAACGYGFSVFVTKSKEANRRVLGCGLNSDSQIGYHAVRKNHPLDLLATPVPIHLPNNPAVIKVACGRAHTVLLTEDGQALTLGHNGYGQCGRFIVDSEDYKKPATPHRVKLSSKISQIYCGQDNSLFVTEEGALYSCGWSADGQTGLGHYNNTAKVSPCVGDVEGVKIVKVSCAADCVLALSDQGDVFGFGNSEYGQLGMVSTEMQLHTPRHLPLPQSVYGRIVDVATTGTACLILNDSGQVFVWGYGILGKGPKVEQSDKPTEIPAPLFGRNEFSPDTKVTSIAGGLSQLAAVNNRGDLYTWGRNRFGSLGLGHLNDQYFPIKVAVSGFVKKISIGVDHCVALCESYV